MKTKELIAMLQKADPGGETECCVGNIPIYFVSKEPAYWDGKLEILIRDPVKEPYYSVIGGKYTGKGDKIQFHTLSITDGIFEDPDNFIVDYSELSPQEVARYQASDEKDRTAARQIELDLAIKSFIEFCRSVVGVPKDKRPYGIRPDLSQLNELPEYPGLTQAAVRFFQNNLKPNEPISSEIEQKGKSAYDVEHEQWRRTISVERYDTGWRIQFKDRRQENE